MRKMETNEKSSHGSLNTNTSVEEEGRLVRLLNWYRQIPVIGKIPVRVLMGLLVAALAILLAVLFPQGDCTCEDQFDDPKLQTMAKAGDKQVKEKLAAVKPSMSHSRFRLGATRPAAST